MAKRTSVNDIKDIEDLDNLGEIVKDKRKHKRSSDKKERRNRHYFKLLIKQQVTHQEDKESAL